MNSERHWRRFWYLRKYLEKQLRVQEDAFGVPAGKDAAPVRKCHPGEEIESIGGGERDLVNQTRALLG